MNEQSAASRLVFVYSTHFSISIVLYAIYVKLVVADVKLVVADVKLVVPVVKLVDAGCEACGYQMLSLWTQDVKFQEP